MTSAFAACRLPGAPVCVQVERVVATQVDTATGQPQVLVKWRGLEYDKLTWEPRSDVEAAATAGEAEGAALAAARCAVAAVARALEGGG